MAASGKMLSLKKALKPVAEEALGTYSGGYIIYGCCWVPAQGYYGVVDQNNNCIPQTVYCGGIGSGGCKRC